MVFPNTGSILQGTDGENQTRTGVSTNIIIKVSGNAIGAIQDFSITEARSIASIDEVGTDGHVDSVPNKSTDVSGTCQRIRFDNLRIAEAFSRDFIHASAQRIPFDIVIFDTFAGTDPEAVLTTVFKNIWINQITYGYKTSDFTIMENMQWKAEYVYSRRGESNVVPGPEGGRNLEITDHNIFELEADRGGRRGALDGPGLLQAVGTATSVTL